MSCVVVDHVMCGSYMSCVVVMSCLHVQPNDSPSYENYLNTPTVTSFSFQPIDNKVTLQLLSKLTATHIGYEPADLTVHPPPRTAEGGFIFFI